MPSFISLRALFGRKLKQFNICDMIISISYSDVDETQSYSYWFP